MGVKTSNHVILSFNLTKIGISLVMVQNFYKIQDTANQDSSNDVPQYYRSYTRINSEQLQNLTLALKIGLLILI
jgi:hypothetical protein